jgi:hypothetical protein
LPYFWKFRRFPERIEGYCLMDEQGNVYVASVKWVFQVMEDGGRRFWF